MPVDRTLADIGELGLLERLGRLVGPPPEGTVGIGDDAAVIPWGRGPVLATTDSMVEGTHFRTDWFRPEEVGYKSLAANLSDAAAMGGRPTHALVSLVLPPTLPVRSVERLFRGMLELARAQDVLVVGGNLARGDAVAVTVALLGSFPQRGPFLRTGARPGDRIYVTGQPGQSHLGYRLVGEADREPDLWRTGGRGLPPWRRNLTRGRPGAPAAVRRFLTPEPRLRLVRELSIFRPTALIDVSDGLAQDLGRLAAGGRRFVVDEERIPRARPFVRLAEALDQDPTAVALWGGEDYELLASLPPQAALKLGPKAVVAGIPITRIGEVEDGTGVALRSPTGTRPLLAAGFRHF